MAICGDFKTMPLVELLQWAGGNQKTGVLEIERNKIRKLIAFRDGRIVGCTSTDPTSLIGHFLISRRQITQRTLQFALKQQEATGARLPDTLIDIGVLSKAEIDEAVAHNALETIYGLFEWERAVFRFRLDASLDDGLEVDLSVDETLLSGAERQDDLDRIRGTFGSSGVVLARTDRPLPARLDGGETAFSILELVDGQRPIAEIVLQAHASEFQVLKLLFALREGGNVEVVEEREPQPGSTSLIDAHDEEAIQLPSLRELIGEAAPQAADVADAPLDERDRGDRDEDGSTETATGSGGVDSDELDLLMQFARDRVGVGDHEAALTMLDTCYAAHPDHEPLKKLMASTEAAYLEKVRKYLLPPEKVPVKLCTGEGRTLDPMEATVLSMIDGESDVQAIVWVAPLREVQVIRTLQKLHDREIIRLDAPAAASG